MDDFFDELKLAIDKIKCHIDKYRSMPNINICIYLGIKNDDTFEYGFNCETFYNKIYETLKNTKWDSYSKCDYTSYNIDDRLVLIEHHIKTNEIFKKKILHEHTFIYKNTPFDFQIVIFEYSKIKQMPMDINEVGRYSIDNYILRNSCIGIYQNEIHLDDCIEIEQGLLISSHSINFTSNSSVYIAHDLLLRLRDIINICEPINNAHLELLSEYNGK